MDIYLEKALDVIDKNIPVQYGILDIGYKMEDIDCEIKSHFVYEKLEFGYTIKLILSEPPHVHQLRVESFERFDYKIECDNKDFITRFYKKKSDDEWFDKEAEVTRVYSRSWVVDVGDK